MPQEKDISTLKEILKIWQTRRIPEQNRKKERRRKISKPLNGTEKIEKGSLFDIARRMENVPPDEKSSGRTDMVNGKITVRPERECRVGRTIFR
jgi:hypothetical protein